LKENVIVGRLIPAGTGLSYHAERKNRQEEDSLMTAISEELLDLEDVEIPETDVDSDSVEGSTAS